MRNHLPYPANPAPRHLQKQKHGEVILRQRGQRMRPIPPQLCAHHRPACARTNTHSHTTSDSCSLLFGRQPRKKSHTNPDHTNNGTSTAAAAVVQNQRGLHNNRWYGTVRHITANLHTCGNKNKPNADRDKKARSLTWKGTVDKS